MNSWSDEFNGLALFIEWAYGEEAELSFIRKVVVYYQNPGRAFMNVLYDEDPYEYFRLTMSSVDPFFDDKKIPAALDLLTSK